MPSPGISVAGMPRQFTRFFILVGTWQKPKAAV
jgi:hypothetical protein